MFPDFPIVFVFFIVIFLVLLIVSGRLLSKGITGRNVHIGAIFASIIVALILTYAIEKYDVSLSNVNLFIQQSRELAQIGCRYAPEIIPLLVENAQNFICRKPSFLLLEIELILEKKIPNKTVREYAKDIIDNLKIANSKQLDMGAFIPNIIWYAVFILGILISLLFISDIGSIARVDLILLAIVWVPLIIIYYIYITRNEKFASLVKCLIAEITANNFCRCLDFLPSH